MAECRVCGEVVELPRVDPECFDCITKESDRKADEKAEILTVLDMCLNQIVYREEPSRLEHEPDFVRRRIRELSKKLRSAR